jgi:hypothetical protein
MAKVKSAGRARAKTTAEARTVASSQESVSAEERQRMIAEAAYFRAQARGFQGGDPVDDWLTAEEQINRILPSTKQ